MVSVIVVLPSSSVRINVLSVSGHVPPQDSVETSRSGGLISLYTPRISISVPSPRRHTQRCAPPGRRSISQTGIVQPSGSSIQRGRCLGLVQASKTSLRGASKTRVTTASRSVGGLSFKAQALFIASLLYRLV